MPRSADDLECRVVMERLEMLIDNELDEVSETAMLSHVASCPACRRELDLAGQVRTTLRGLAEHEVPATVIDAAMAATRSVDGGRSERTKPGGLGLRPLQAVIAAAAVVLLVVALNPRHGSELPPGEPDVEQVTAETRLALAYLGTAVRRAERRVEARLAGDQALAAAAESVSKSLSLARRTVAPPAPE